MQVSLSITTRFFAMEDMGFGVPTTFSPTLIKRLVNGNIYLYEGFIFLLKPMVDLLF